MPLDIDNQERFGIGWWIEADFMENGLTRARVQFEDFARFVEARPARLKAVGWRIDGRRCAIIVELVELDGLAVQI